MSAIKNFVGIDISKGWLDFAARREGWKVKKLEFRLDNNPDDIRTLKRVLKKGGITLGKKTLFTFEHIGTYSIPLKKYLSTQGCLMCEENALRIKRSLGIQRGKSDQIDARRILEYSVRNVDKLHLWEQQSESMRMLKDLLALRERLMKIKHLLIVPLKDKHGYLTRKSISVLEELQHGTTVQLEKAIKRSQVEVQNIIEKDDELQRLSELVTSVPCVGLIIAANLICMTRGFTAFTTGKQLVSYAGCAPFSHSSGTSVKGRAHVSHLANKKLKALMHLAALAAIGHKGELQRFYKRKVKEGKPKMSVINAVRSKILLRIASVVKRNSPYLAQKAYKAYHAKMQNASQV